MTNTIESKGVKPVNQLLNNIRTIAEILIEDHGQELPDRSIYFASLPILDDRLLIATIKKGRLKLNFGEELFPDEKVGIVFRGQDDPEYYGGGVKTFFHRLLGRQPTLEVLELYEQYLNLALEAENEE